MGRAAIYVLSTLLLLDFWRSGTIQERNFDKDVVVADTFEHELEEPQPQLVLEVPKVDENLGNSKLYLLGVNQAPTQSGTIWVLGADRESDCTWRLNYMCKFWYFIRCVLFRDVQVRKVDSAKILVHRARPGDAVLIISRRQNTENGSELFRKVRNRVDRGVRVGVFHVGDEHRTAANASWYSDFDFILRNYWVPNPAPNVMFVPLGGQMPSLCSPSEPSDNTQCTCYGSSVLKASKRPFLWSFSGASWSRRMPLICAIRRSSILSSRGEMRLSKNFGGRGSVGTQNDPKHEHLRSIAESSFVFAPCGNVMETHRAYEALLLGAIPIVENCEGEPNSSFWPFKQLLIAGGPSKMVHFVERYAHNNVAIDNLQKLVLKRWKLYTYELALNASKLVLHGNSN